ncbi:hypothetical protein ACJ41O_007470 [Fusarium nematophilum]
MSLDPLASELLALILQSVDSPLDLYHLISAAPCCLEAFSQSPQIILSSVIQNAFPSDTIQYALAVLQAPSSSAKVPCFLDKYFDPSSSFSLPTTKDELIKLCRLYHRVSYFSDAYFAKTMHKLSQVGQQRRFDDGESPQPEGHDEKQEAPWPSGWALPSPSERSRLQRALLRFELYSRIFPGYEHDPDRPPHLPIVGYPADQQVELFLDKLLLSEVEEIYLLQQYYASTIESFIHDLEDEVVKAVLAAPGVVIPSISTNDLSPGKETPHDDDLVECGTFGLGDLGLLNSSGSHRFRNYLGYMTSLGLDFLYTIASDERKRREAILSTRPFIQDFLPQALSHGSVWGDLDDALRAMVDDFFKDESNFLGYRVVAGGLIQALMSPAFRYRKLRDLGYVFWDEGRVRSPEVRERLAAGQNMEAREGRDYGWTYWETLEGRLKGVMLPREETARIRREFVRHDCY